jgi:hypothetical protein
MTKSFLVAKKIFLIGFFTLLLGHTGYGLIYLIYNEPFDKDSNFTSGFESGNLDEWTHRGAKQLCCDHSLEMVKSPSREGDYATKITLNRTDPDVKSSKRAELRLKSTKLHNHYWYTFSTFFPNDWKASSAKVTFAQWHCVPDKLLGESGRSPPLSISVVNEELKIVLYWDSTKVNKSVFYRSNNEVPIWSGPLLRGQWIDWVVHVRWSYQEDGFLEIWQNKNLVAQRSGPNTYNDWLAPYFKIGVYIPSWKNSKPNQKDEVNTYSVFFDAINVREGKSFPFKTSKSPYLSSPLPFIP